MTKTYEEQLTDWKLRVGYREPETQVSRLEKLEDKITDIINFAHDLENQASELYSQASSLQDKVLEVIEQAKAERSK